VSSIRDQIVAATITALNAVGKPCDFERSRATALTDADLPRGVVYPVRDIPEDPFLAGPVTRSRLTMMCEIRALGTAALRPDQAVDPIYTWVVAKLVGNTLGGLALKLQEGDSTFVYGQGDSPICLLAVEVVATHQHLTANAEASK